MKYRKLLFHLLFFHLASISSSAFSFLIFQLYSKLISCNLITPYLIVALLSLLFLLYCSSFAHISLPPPPFFLSISPLLFFAFRLFILILYISPSVSPSAFPL